MRDLRALEPVADINVTSLVDVAFVLLIIFMIIAPIMQGNHDGRQTNPIPTCHEQFSPRAVFGFLPSTYILPF